MNELNKKLADLLGVKPRLNRYFERQNCEEKITASFARKIEEIYPDFHDPENFVNVIQILCYEAKFQVYYTNLKGMEYIAEQKFNTSGLDYFFSVNNHTMEDAVISLLVRILSIDDDEDYGNECFGKDIKNQYIKAAQKIDWKY